MERKLKEINLDLEEDLWAHVFVMGMKGHFCPKRLAGPLAAELQMRLESEGCTEVQVTIEQRHEGMIDLPGMLWLKRPYERIKIDTFTLEIPSQEFTFFAQKLLEAPLRKFANGQEYYKIHGYTCCVVFTPDQRELVLQEMERMLPAAIEHAEAADREFSAVMDDINKDGPRVISHKDKYSKYAPLKVPVPPKDNN